MKKRVALVTWSGLLHGAESEQLLLSSLAAHGVDARMVDWRDVAVDFSQFELIVLRSCWNYHLHAKEFADWLVRTAARTPILNEAATVLWNSYKFYLRELKAKGVEIVPTCFVSSNESMHEE